MNLISIKEAASLSGRSIRTVWRWIEQGYLQKYTTGINSAMIDRGELEKLLTPRKS